MGAVILEEHCRDERPLGKSPKTSFKLPDAETDVWIYTTGNGSGTDYFIGSGDRTLARWKTDGTKARVSPAMVNDDRAQHEQVLRLELLSLDKTNTRSPFGSDTQNSELTLAWAAVYALWLHPDHRDDDLIAISVNSERLDEYIRCTGLGVVSPFSPAARTPTTTNKDTVYWLTREAFWQGAGAPDSQHWLRSRPEVTSFPGFNGSLGVFASQIGFTRKGNVCTVHPVRPPKPKPGAVVYSRYIIELGQHLQIRHIDAENPVHFETYKRWQNSDRVNASWQERGPDEHHRAYLAAQLADPHTMSCLFEWDGELAGYTELGWMMEDNAACFIGSNCNIVVGEHDQNSHILVGEEHFRGGKRYEAVATSIKHCCFLRDPRTKQVIAEPRFDLSHVAIQSKYLPQEKKKRFHLPHKTAMLFALQRDRFFQEAHLV
ncbi:lysine N-acyltransferase [Fusarium albosuccineum]|uniref:Lysine N-acyltransferase n=1 Tax=Fusarium albosuccineum TaxID=1237068 RepID=A0A8H4L728_9HYPO|nr:lysine N-acyltransferase [Fusarium albosuccineum]